MKKFVLIGAVAVLFVAGLGISRLIAGPALDPGPQAAPIKPSAVELASVVASDANQMGFNLFAEVNKNAKGNIFFSPASISMALGMTYNGAAGETAAGMAKAMSLGKLAPADTSSGNSALLDMLTKADPKVELNIVNGIWVDNRCKVLPTFIDTNKAAYGAEIANMDLTTPAAAKPINEWIAKGTKDKIKDLLKPDDFNPYTRMVLANAVYFKSPWAYPFEEAMTKDGDFTLLDGTTKKVPMMTQTEYYKYLENEKVQMIALPYGENNRLQMNVILPKATVKAEDVPTLFTLDNWNKWNATEQKNSRVKLQLPRIKMRYEQSLNDALISMGMEDAFSMRADFNKMTGEKDLFISVVRHQATLDVDEKGTEATAATAVVMEFKSMPPAPQYNMIVNRPFFVVINDSQTGAILFMGLVKDPQA